MNFPRSSLKMSRFDELAGRKFCLVISIEIRRLRDYYYDLKLSSLKRDTKTRRKYEIELMWYDELSKEKELWRR